MAASWCYLRLWYKKTGEKLYKTPRRLLTARLPNPYHHFTRCITLTDSVQKDNFQRITYTGNTAKGQKKDVEAPLPEVYSPQYVEAAWYDWWLSQGYFKPLSQQEDRAEEERFVMILPPPNVTGTLHLGHALTNSVQDALVRWHRMKGHATVWVPGTDHAGIATQVVVEKKLLAERQLTRQQLGRQDFEDQVWKWKREKMKVIESQMKALGSSLDWTQNFFTLDEGPSQAVTEAFVRLYENGKVYRAQRLINWSCSLQSSISDIEVDNVALEGRTQRLVPGHADPVDFGLLHSFAYPVKQWEGPWGHHTYEEIEVSTTRLETMLGDVAVAVHPDDERYAHLVGREVEHPFTGKLLPIIADTFVDPHFGSGAVKITPAHDPVDFEVGRRHGLPLLTILDDQGRICGHFPYGLHFMDKLSGMPRFQAREGIRQELEGRGLYRGQCDHAMVLPVCSRSGDVVEPRLKDQWFLHTKDMAHRALHAAQSGELTFCAAHHQAVWAEWLSKDRDWCLSRQLWWGHRIPAYKFQIREKTDKGWQVAGDTWLAARSEREARDKFRQKHPHVKNFSVTQDEDVLDTWFSSALLPFSVFGWPQETSALRGHYPLSLMETGQDILFFWVARMVMLGLELTHTLPFKQVLLHGIVRDGSGRKMSKSLGNVLDPLDIIHGASLQDLQTKVERSGLSLEETVQAVAAQKKDFPDGIPECGTDALRFTLCSYDFKADTVQMDVGHTRAHRLLCNKVWQAFRFLRPHLQGDFTPLTTFTLSESAEATDRWIVSGLSRVVEDCDGAFTSHSLHQATRALHTFWLTHFCDVYLEYSKAVFQAQDARHQEDVRQILHLVSDTFLRALSPFMPFLTEELFQRLPPKAAHWPESVCLASYPQPEQFPWQDASVEREMSQALEVCQHVMSIRQKYNTTRNFLPVYIGVASSEQQRGLDQFSTVMERLCRARPITTTVTDPHAPLPPGCASSVVNASVQVHVHLQGQVDVTREMERLSRRHQKVSMKQELIAHRLAELVRKGKGHIPAAQKLQAKEDSLLAQLKQISDSMESVSSMEVKH